MAESSKFFDLMPATSELIRNFTCIPLLHQVNELLVAQSDIAKNHSGASTKSLLWKSDQNKMK